jgi:hypothetical protein
MKLSVSNIKYQFLHQLDKVGIRKPKYHYSALSYSPEDVYYKQPQVQHKPYKKKIHSGSGFSDFLVLDPLINLIGDLITFPLYFLF